MKLSMRTLSIRVSALVCATAAFAAADTLTLRSGESVQGTFLGGSAREVRFDANGQIRTYDIGQVRSVTFNDSGYDAPVQSRSSAPPPTPSSGPPRLRRAVDPDFGGTPQAPPQAPPVRAGISIPADTAVTIRMIDAVNSETARLGQTFRASLDEPVFVDGREVIPRGADVLTKLVGDQQSGKIQGRTVMTLALSTITVNGQPVDVTSTDVQTASDSRGARSAKVVGGTAALGAIIGAIAGGGKGAAIGAGSGAAVGTGAEVLTGGQKVRIPSETRLTFRLQAPARI